MQAVSPGIWGLACTKIEKRSLDGAGLGNVHSLFIFAAMNGKIDFELFGLQLVGPNNFVTGHLILLTAFTAAFLAWKRWPRQWSSRAYWMWFFFLLGLQASVSAFGHVAVRYGGDYLLLLSFFINTPLMYLLGRALLEEMESLSERTFRRWHAFLIVQAVVYTLAVPVVHHFWVSIFNAVVSLLTIIPFSIVHWYRRGNREVARMLLFAELATVLAGLVYAFHVRLADWFDKDDFGHIFVLVSVFFFYESVVRRHRTSAAGYA